MALLNDILIWTESLPNWQRDAVRRLFQNEEGLSDQDFTDLYALLKAENGLPNPDELKATYLGPEHLPAETKSGETVVLRALRDLKNVNCIISDQTLTFAEKGITVIYGENSSGKSGYVRVLKHACRARDQSEQVLTNANDPAATSAIPTAFFDLQHSGVIEEIPWSRDKIAPEKLSLISIFDSRCARSYITDEEEVAYIPFGLDIVVDLANIVLPELSRRLDDEISKIDINQKPIEHLKGDTKVGKFIESLSSETDSAEIKRIGKLAEEEKRRLTELSEALNEPDPAAKSKELNLSASRLKSLGNKVIEPLSWVNDTEVEKLKDLDQAKSTAEEAEKQAANALQAGETLLAGTGEQTWKVLYEAARKYSVEAAYPEESFPNTEDGAKCPLCQELLEETARERLIRFEKYIIDDVAKIANQQRTKLKTAYTEFEKEDISIRLDPTIIEEIESLDVDLPPIVLEFEDSLKIRRASIIEALSSHDWSTITGLTENPRKRIRTLAASQLQSSRIYGHASNIETKRRLITEQNELIARQDLSNCIEVVLALLQRMKEKTALEKCYGQLKTKPISDKSKQLGNKAVTKKLKMNLDKEFEALGIPNIKTTLKERIDHGQILHQLVLDLPTSNKISEILSEGEQRAIAIGAFLAELSLANHSCGIVLDDPVSSLDHWRRADVARRLVKEASLRQVIVFTHDTTFLGQLCDEIDENGTSNSMMFLEWKENSPGYVKIGLPWDHQGYKERIDVLEKAQRKLAKSWPAYPNEKNKSQMRIQYDRLRATIERVVQ